MAPEKTEGRQLRLHETMSEPRDGTATSTGLLLKQFSLWGPGLVLTLLVLLYFFPLVLHPTQILYSDASDLVAEHIPAKRFLVRSFQETGELPLWCPYQFAGTPFVHDIQVALFYPPHLALLLLPESWVGPALSWLVVLHVLLAGLTMLAYARHRGLFLLPALVAAAGYMFAGRWMLHLLGGGHYITIGLAWLPLVLLCLERAIRGGGLLWATTAGLVFALLILCTQPQWTFYAGLFIAFSTLGTALEEAGYLGGSGELSRHRTTRALGRWLGYGAWAAGLAVALATVQLLPTLEAARNSTRVAGVDPEEPYESLRALLFLVGPSLFGRAPYLMWEDRGGLALLWMIAAVLAPLLRGGQVRYQAGLCLGMLLLGVCGAFAGRWLPVFSLFRQHPRILLIASLPIAYLAGVTTQALFLEASSPAQRRLCIRVALLLGTCAFLAPVGFALGRFLRHEPLRFHVYWVVTPVFFALAVWLLRAPTGPRQALLWSALLLADLWALTWPLVGARPQEEVYQPAKSVRFLADHREGEWRVLDIEYENETSPLGQGAPQALLCRLQAARGFNPIDVRHYREYLAFIADDGRPLRALDSAVTQPVPLYFPLKNRTLIDLLGVRYLLHPSAEFPPGDGWEERLVDEAPVGYSLAVGGFLDLPPYTISENLNVLPRAFVVPRARPLPSRPDILNALKTTDFRETVLLAGHDGSPPSGGAEKGVKGGFRPAEITEYLPNRVKVHVEGAAPGFLVLTDVWYPGWVCTVDDEPVPVYRANHAFRAVEVPAGAHDVVFRFEPASFGLGRRITLGSLAAVTALLLVLAVCYWPWCRRPLLLMLLALLFFLPLLLHPAQVLYSDYSDLLAEHIPAKRFLVRSFQETGELPLWCPYQFAGSPFVHDIQVALFYPPHLALLLLPESWVGPALSWLVVLHVLLAGLTMLAYARHRGLLPLPALVAAAGYMFAPKWLMHLLGGGHYITIGLAWLPLVLLCLERAIRRGSVSWGVGAGGAYALLILSTQPQWTFYAGLFVALWTLGTALEEAGCFDVNGARDRRRMVVALGRWVGFGALTAVLAALLTAVQLLPTLEAAGQSSRAAGVASLGILDGGVRVLLFLVGPALTADPPVLMWEDRGGLALLWLFGAVVAPLLRRGQVRYQAAVGLFLFLFALGGALLFQRLPGFNLFRQPARMMVVASFPVAYLAGVATQALCSSPGMSDDERRRCRRWLLRLGVAVLLLCGGMALRLTMQHERVRFHPYWVVLPVIFGAALWLLARRGPAPHRLPGLAWSALLLIDLWVLGWPLVAVRPESDVYVLPECVRFVARQKEKHSRVLDLDRMEDGRLVGTPLGQGAPLALLAKVEAVRGYSPLDVLRYREYLQFIADKDSTLRALESDFTYPVINNFPPKNNFPRTNRSLLDLLGVRYLLVPTEDGLSEKDIKAGPRDNNVVAYDFITGGLQALGAYTVYENETVLARAFVVPRAEPLPQRSAVLEALKATDFRKTVLLENYDPPARREGGSGTRHTVRIRRYDPNRVELDVSGDAGYLVLTDVWYPGWECTVDGEPVPVYRANYAFRAVEVPAGRHEVIFRFAPASYRRGRLASLGALAAVFLFGMGLLVRRVRRAEPAV
jgi:hypothetical protein